MEASILVNNRYFILLVLVDWNQFDDLLYLFFIISLSIATLINVFTNDSNIF